jgi:Mg2+ and Co2+ transporter CorA
LCSGLGKGVRNEPRVNALSKAILFDRDHVEHLEDLSQRPRRLNGSKLLWVNSDTRSDDVAARVAEAFDLDDRTREQLASSDGRAVFEDHGRYIHVTTYSPREEDEQLDALRCIVGQNWVITAEDRSLPVLEEFTERVSGSGDTGVLDGPAFLATLLEWVLGAYSAAFERIEQRLEEFDVQAMRGNRADEDIEQLVAMRKEVGILADARGVPPAHPSRAHARTRGTAEGTSTPLAIDHGGGAWSEESPRVRAHVDGREIRKAIVVLGKLVNIVV